MINPTTPQKRGDGINEIVGGLNARWALDIPIWDGLRSPSKVPKPDSPEETILNTIRFLYWQHRGPMQHALDEFESHAPFICSEWKFKPRADTNTLPTRAPADSSLRRESFLSRNELPDNAIRALKEALLGCLLKAKDHPSVHIPPDLERKPGSSSFLDLSRNLVESEISIVEPPTAPSSARKTIQSRIQSFFPPIRNASPSLSLVQPELPSSDDFKPDLRTADILHHLNMPDVPAPHMDTQLVMRCGRASPTGSVDEDYTTPPTTPVRELLFGQVNESPSIRSRDKFGHQTFLQKVDPIKLPDFTMPTRKRSMVEASKVLESRKVSRDGMSHQFPRVYEVNHLEPGPAA
ncbi:MAG: hypothetical protein Q9187_008858, partial [Circinaria calcarea]